MDGDEIVLAPEQVQLSGLNQIARLLRGIYHDEVAVGVGVAAGTFVRLGHVLECQLVTPECPPEQPDLLGAGVTDVEPQPVLAVGEQLAEPFDADLNWEAVIASIEDESRGSHGSPPGR